MRRAGVMGLLAACVLAFAPSADAATKGRVAFSSSANQIFTVAPNGHGLTQITHDRGPAAHPDFSPDGRSIAFDVGGRWLDVAAANGTGEHTIQVDVTGIDPSWSPDASQLAFTGVNYGPAGNVEDTYLYITQADGSNFRRIGNGSQPDWSPRASWIVYRPNAADTDGCPGIWRIRPDGSDNGPVAAGIADGARCAGGGSDPSFSPNGKRVAFVSSDGTTIFTTSLHGGTSHRVVHDARLKSSPVFSPNGRRIAYSTSDGIWVVKAKGGKPRRISKSGGYLSWQPVKRG